jgi:tripartite-type tricarboxylate transporter receptor subunit TctC
MRGVCDAVKLSALTAVLLLVHITGAAAEYPDHPITFFVSSAAGGGADVFSRIVAAKLTEQLGQPVIVVNKPGAGGIVGTEAFIHAQPDGYTIGYAGNPQATHHLTFKQPRFVLSRDAVPVNAGAEYIQGLLVTGSGKLKSVADLVAYAKANPGKINAANSGPFTSADYLSSWFQSLADVKFTNVSYDVSRMMTSVMSGEADLMFLPLTLVKAGIEAGQLRPIAVLGDQRDPNFPDVPTMKESGFDMVYTSWTGILAPAKTPRPIVERLNKEINAALASPDVADKLQKQGLRVVGGTPEFFAQRIDNEVENLKRIMAVAHMEPLD